MLISSELATILSYHLESERYQARTMKEKKLEVTTKQNNVQNTAK